MSLKAIQGQVAALFNEARAQQMKRYFKTGPGQYGQGDTFGGLTNPQCRRIAKTNQSVGFDAVAELLGSKLHEQRMIGLVILSHKFAEDEEQAYQCYLSNLKAVNSWDLVDLSAPIIVGRYIFKRCQTFKEITTKEDPRNILYTLVGSTSIWERRISLLSTLTFIREGQYYDSLLLASQLLGDKEDLIHKAVGWMLREVGKREQPLLEKFLQEYYKDIPRTALRSAIEKLPEEKRLAYLHGKW